jgi:hypothetical protein
MTKTVIQQGESPPEGAGPKINFNSLSGAYLRKVEVTENDVACLIR